MDKEQVNKLIDERIKKVVPKILKGSAFTDRKLTDTPTDDLQVVPRKYVNLNGVLTNRPNSSVATMGQRYFATDTNVPMTYQRNSSVWVNGIGSVVAQG
jgi:hypothetical protein